MQTSRRDGGVKAADRGVEGGSSQLSRLTFGSHSVSRRSSHSRPTSTRHECKPLVTAV